MSRPLLCEGVKLPSSEHLRVCVFVCVRERLPRPHKHVSGLRLITCQTVGGAPQAQENGLRRDVKHVREITAQRSLMNPSKCLHAQKTPAFSLSP